MPFFLFSDGGLFVLSVIYYMHITLCRLTTRTALMEWLLAHQTTDYSLHFKTDLNICTYNNNPGNQRNKHRSMMFLMLWVYTALKHLYAACI